MGLPKSALVRDAWKLFEAGYSAEDGGIETYLARILSQCVEWFGATGGSVFLREGSSDRFKLSAQAGCNSHIPAGATIRAGTGIAGLSIETGEPLLVTDPSRHPLLEGRINTRQVTLGSSIVMPLFAPNEGCIGVLNLSRSVAYSYFTEADLNKVAALARQISLAVSNARLFASETSARKAESAARSKLQSVVQSLGVAVMVFDGKGRITDLNRKAQELVTKGGKWQRALDDVSEELTRAVLDSLEKVRSSKFSSTKVRDEQQDRSWSIVGSVLEGGGATIVLEETTDEERSHREMSRLARLAEIGQMTSAIAHEIRNPLTGIRSAAQMIGSAPEHGAEFAEIIEQEVLKLNEVCEEFLEFSRPLTLRRTRIDLAKLAQNLAERHREQFEGHAISLSVEIEGERPTIEGDVLRLEQVMRNLVLNAMQACARGGVVRLILRNCGFSVEDTGRGMQEEELQRLFTPFFTTKPNGTGLGLCNVRKIIDAHSGNIAVSSKPGVGTRFDVSVGGNGEE